MSENLLLDAKGVYSIYKGKEGAANVVALRGLNIEMKRGEFVAIELSQEEPAEHGSVFNFHDYKLNQKLRFPI